MKKMPASDPSFTTLVVVPIDPTFPIMGGIEAYSRNLLKYFSNSGINSILLGISYNNIQTDIDGFQFIPVSHGRRINGYEYLFKLLLKTPFLRIPRSTIIYAQKPEFILPFMLFRSKNKKIVHLHGNSLKLYKGERLRLVSFFYKLVESYVLKHSNIIITTDEITRACYIREYPWIHNKMRVIPMAIDLGSFRLLDRECLRKQYGFKENEKIIMYVGRIVKEKNLGFLLRSFSFVFESLPKSELVFVGDGKEMADLKQLSIDLQLSKVRFMGNQQPEKIPEILNCADVLVLCSTSEGSPNVVKEALACGVPVVSTPVGDVPTVIVNDKIGKIVDADPRKFAEAIIEFCLNNQKDLTRMECAKIASNFSFDKMGIKITEVMKELF